MIFDVYSQVEYLSSGQNHIPGDCPLKKNSRNKFEAEFQCESIINSSFAEYFSNIFSFFFLLFGTLESFDMVIQTTTIFDRQNPSQEEFPWIVVALDSFKRFWQ